MNVPDRVGSKIEGDLRSKLVSAKPDESLRIIARLTPSVAPSKVQTSRPSEFASREDWRRALITRQRDAVKQMAGPILDHIRSLGVTVVAGGDLSETVVLQGQSKSLIEALELDGLAHADLDRALSLR